MGVYKGWNAKLFKDGSQIGYADSASMEIATNLEAFYELGSRQPIDLTEGNEEVTGSFSRAWINKDYLNLVTSDGALSDFDLCFTLGPGPNLYVYCYGCKFETGALDIPQDGFLKEDYDFRAKTVYLQ